MGIVASSTPELVREIDELIELLVCESTDNGRHAATLSSSVSNLHNLGQDYTENRHPKQGQKSNNDSASGLCKRSQIAIADG